jgi:diaminopimelate decarboxylase
MRREIVPTPAPDLPASPKLSRAKPDVSGVENLIRAMLKKHRTPFMLIRRSVLERQFQRFRKCLPEVAPYYAIKANPHPKIIKTFIKLDAGFDVASASEMKQVLALGARRDKIIFANTVKSSDDIITARRRQVSMMTFDNEPELYKIIGGGFPIQHFDNEIGVNFERMAVQIRKQIRQLFDKKVQFIAEPGRLLVGPAGILVTQVIGRAFRNNKNYYYLNDGIYGDFSGMVFDHCKYEFKTLRRGQTFLSALAGPTCDSFDTLSLDVEIPELYVGDVVYVKNIGAYSSASAVANFNGFPPAKTVLV